MAFCKPSKKDRRLLRARIKEFTFEWKHDIHNDSPISEVWMAWASQDKEMVQSSLDWLGFCILGAFDSHIGGRTEIREMIFKHVNVCLE